MVERCCKLARTCYLELGKRYTVCMRESPEEIHKRRGQIRKTKAGIRERVKANCETKRKNRERTGIKRETSTTIRETFHHRASKE